MWQLHQGDCIKIMQENIEDKSSVGVRLELYVKLTYASLVFS